MYVHLSTAGQLARSVTKPGRLSWRRSVALAGGLSVYGALAPLVALARWTDALAFPGRSKTLVPPPLFVVATPRSGTTFLHHLLALDEKNFTHFKLYQTVFPTVWTDRLVHAARSAQATLNLPLTSAVKWFNSRIFQGWTGIHEVALDGEEEDESLFVYALASPALYLLWPFPDDLPACGAADSWSETQVERLARDYRATVQRHVFGGGDVARTPLIKNVLLPGRLAVAQRAFPQAKYVRLVRDPVRAIPSALNLFTTLWAAHSPEISRSSLQTRLLGDLFIDHFRRLHCLARDSGPERVLTVRFEDLIADPLTEVERIYDFLGKTLSPEQRALLLRELGDTTSFQSSHRANLEDFGWTSHEVRERLADVIADLGYPGVESGNAARSKEPRVSPVPTP